MTTIKHATIILRALFMALGTSAGAQADEGEIIFDMPLAFEVANTSHPATSVDLFSPASTTIIKPRFGLGLRYGLTPSLYAGLGAHMAGSTAIRTAELTIDNSTGDLLTAQYVELSTPVLIGYRSDSGGSTLFAAELELAPVATYWGVQDLVDFADLDAAGLPAALEKTAANTWLLAGIARLTILFDVRLFDVFVIAAGPNVALSMNTLGQPAVHAGLTIRPSFAWGGSL